MLLPLIIILFFVLIGYLLYSSWPHRASGHSCGHCGAPAGHCPHTKPKPCPLCGASAGQCGCPKAPPREQGQGHCPFC